MAKKIIIYSILISCAISSGMRAVSQTSMDEGSKKVLFREVWAYLMAGEEKRMKGAGPFTDVCYFSAGLDYRGSLVGHKPPPAEARNGETRVHMVVTALSNAALLHFCLDPSYGIRSSLVDDIVRASGEYHGVQIDFEAVPARDRDHFVGFLAELKGKLNAKKILSVAVPPRRRVVEDAYDYSALSAVADRIIVMAYDQHWSGSAPGAVASTWWCREVAAFSKSRIDPGKLIMGIPLYGRAWQDNKLSGSVTANRLEEMKKTFSPKVQICDRNGPYFTFRENVEVTVYFDTAESILEKMKTYSAEGVRGISFWRIGQGSPDIWNHVEIVK